MLLNTKNIKRLDVNEEVGGSPEVKSNVQNIKISKYEDDCLVRLCTLWSCRY